MLFSILLIINGLYTSNHLKMTKIGYTNHLKMTVLTFLIILK